MKSTEELAQLYQGYLHNELDPEELNRFLQATQSPGKEQEISQLMDKTWEKMFHVAKQAQIIPFRKRRWVRIAAAAAVLVFLAGGYLFYKSQIPNLPAGRQGSKSQIVERNEVEAPQSNKATLQLADGRIIVLDNQTNGQLAIGNDVTVLKEGDQIIYQSAIGPSTSSGAEQSAIKYNTLSNPRGSKVISLTLNDGTKVFLNSESSMKYPVAFTGNERMVEITGEAYFEVAHDASKPFKVNKGTVVVTVLGTHFNVNAYDDEEGMRVTLLEGKVQVGSLSTVNRQPPTELKPGQQAKQLASGEWQVASGVDISEVMSWKNVQFIFNRTDVKTALRQIARWYNVQVEYNGVVRGFFSGTISRQQNISEVLKMLEMTKEIHLTLEEKKIVVRQ